MIRPNFSSIPAVWLWRVSLIVMILAVSLIRHLDVLAVMWLYVAWFGLGLILGVLVDVIDRRVLLKKYQDFQPTQPASQTDSVTQSQPATPLAPVTQPDSTSPTQPATPTKPVTSSLLFYLSLIPVSLFVITSSGSALGAGLILGLWVAILSDLVTAPDSDFIRQNYLYQLKQPLSDLQTTWLIRGGFGWLLLLTILAMF